MLIKNIELSRNNQYVNKKYRIVYDKYIIDI